MRRATVTVLGIQHRTGISIHALLAESDSRIFLDLTFQKHFYPRSPCGERQPGERHASSQQEFLSTLSLRRATFVDSNCNFSQKFLSTLSLRRATQAQRLKIAAHSISIHALLAESDHPQTSDHPHNTNFYPRSPCGERLFDTVQIVIIIVFLSTLSLRRATRGGIRRYLATRFLSTLSLRRATYQYVSSDFWRGYFYPRSPCGERRVTVLGIQHRTGISIHALLAESDLGNAEVELPTWNFYPRSPCGERLSDLDAITAQATFLSTLSLRRATAVNIQRPTAEKNFYPRSPCGERPDGLFFFVRRNRFLSTLSLRRATHAQKKKDRHSVFLSTLSLRRATRVDFFFVCCIIISIHALLAESDVWPGLLARPFFIISIHALLAESDAALR